MTAVAKVKDHRNRLSGVEVVALCVVVAAVTVAVYRSRLQHHFFYSAGALSELESLEKYGLFNRVSRNFEELIIRDYFGDKRSGVFLDVGANHYRNENNTYFLEKSQGWSGVAIDALAELEEDYKRHRPRTRFVAMFVSDVADTSVEFFVPRDNMSSSSTAAATVRSGSPGARRLVQSTTLDAVLHQAGIDRIDFMSMDIELSEPKALAGFDIDRFQPALVCIEAHAPVRQEILDYFARHRYVIVGKYLRVDPHNLYFAPLRSP
jgi:FkbM family methyltransferase